MAASPAYATVHHPTGNYAPYADCPLSDNAVVLCLLAQTTSGEFTVGTRTVPINKTITLQGGLVETPETEETGAYQLVAAENGETLSKTALYVPGGLFNSKPPESWPKEAKEHYEEMINKGLTGVTETTELAKPASDVSVNPSNLVNQEGVALELPVKVKLGNFLLGNNCYVGSEANPIVLRLTTGTTEPPEPNKPIKGKVGEIIAKEEFNIVELLGGSLVDNAFAAPAAKGCGAPFEGLVDSLVDSLLGVPSAAGHNTAILNGNLGEATSEGVLASE
ncbi:MAG TPA: hypothetical protein VL979_10455 [Solirubrobacteraceae bacterium]|nr:hypothetical protein [Solirubrobacteraceae bacterium]